jgi:SAM-dependent methyltransferase
MSLISNLKALIPQPVKQVVKAARSAITPHNWTYDRRYYEEMIDPPARAAAAIMARSLYEWRHPKTVVDVGCGSGALLASFRALGCDVRGLEYSDAGLNFCRARGLSVEKFNIEKDAFQSSGADLVVSFEVAEHLAARNADRYIKLLCSISPHIAMSAAIPGQGGTEHINEQPHSYWIEKFEANGRRFDSDTSRRLSSEWRQPGLASWYSDNVMVFF